MDAIDADELVRLTGDLVSFESTNPPGNEGPIMEFLEDRLESSPAAFTVEHQEVKPGRPNLIARKGNPANGRLLLTGHVDVVPANASDWTGDPFELRSEGPRVVGRGTSDMKGALAAKILAAEAYLAATPDPGEVILAFVVGEETTGLGSEALVEAGIEADAAILGEPTDLQLCVAQKGVVRYEIRITGQSAHSSRPENGVNVIEAMRVLLNRLADVNTDMQAHTHPLLTPACLTVTEANAGIAPNVIPDQATVTIDWRTVPDESDLGPDDFDSRIEDAITGITDDGRDPVIEYDRWLFAEAAEVSRDSTIVTTLADAAAETGNACEVTGFNATTDARHFIKRAGIPTVLFGPGTVEDDAHTVDESISVDDLVAAAETYHATLSRFLG